MLRKNKTPKRIVSPLKKINRPSAILLILCCSAFFACKKETIKVSWEELNSPTDVNLTAVHFTDSEHGYVVGGSTWYKGYYLETENGGTSWVAEEIANKQLFDLDFNENGIAHTVGIDGYLFSNKFDNGLPAESWTFHRMPRWDILRGACFNSRNEGVLVGGIAFDHGAIMVVNPDYTVPKKDTFPNQLNAVCYSDDETIHVAGYGILLRSTDRGATWVDSGIVGDFFQAISFPSPEVGYIIGYNGTILKTTDKGANWKNIRRGDAITVSDQPFLNLHFIDENKGYIVGENGLCWRTLDGGDNWQVIGDLPGFDFNDVYVVDGMVYIVGEGGRMLRFEE